MHFWVTPEKYTIRAKYFMGLLWKYYIKKITELYKCRVKS